MEAEVGPPGAAAGRMEKKGRRVDRSVSRQKPRKENLGIPELEKDRRVDMRETFRE